MINSGSQTELTLFICNLYLNEFNRLKNNWKIETAFISDYNKIINNPSYLSIIRLGKNIIPLILKELRDNDGLWFYALEQLTNKKVALDTINPTYQELKQAWLDWGVKNNYIKL